MNDACIRVLVVDDNRLNRLKFARGLERRGHTVSVAEGGREALRMMRESGFDLILLDIVMPEVDGFEVLSEMKADSALASRKVIMISGVEDADAVSRCLSMGADDFLTKPVDEERLNASIAAVLDRGNKEVE